MSKRVLHHPEVPESEAATSVWRSIREHEDTIKFRHEAIREFYDQEDAMSDEERELSRRNFVKLMGASTALAGMGMVSCRRPESYILPYADGPEWVVPGRPLFYATTMPSASGGVPLTVKTYEARPTTVHPNVKHPDNMGAEASVSASVLNLYDPWRSRFFLNNGEKTTKEKFASFFEEFYQNPQKLGIVLGGDDSPTKNRLLGEIQKKFPETKLYRYEALENDDAAVALGKAFGESRVRLTPQLEKADRVLSLDSDFIELDAKASTLKFSKKRQGGGADYTKELEKDEMNRLYQVETVFSLTGGMADHRLRVAPSQVAKVAVAIGYEIQKLASNAKLGKALSGLEKAEFSGDDLYMNEWVQACAKDLVASKGASLILVGTQQPKEIHLLAVAMNEALGAFGSTLIAYADSSSNEEGTIMDLKRDIEQGEVESLLLMTPSNPLFDAAREVGFKQLLEKVKVSIHFGERLNKTSYACDWHIPATHYLESWGDTLTANGVYSVIQPMILPLYENCVSELDVLSSLAYSKELEVPTEKEPAASYKQVKYSFTKNFFGKGINWKDFLKNGYAKASGYRAVNMKSIPSLTDLNKIAGSKPTKDRLEVILSKDHSVGDGRNIDNAWMQEAPDPVTKLTWDNAATVSPKTAKELGLYDKITELETWNAGRPEYNEAGRAKAPMAKVTVDGAEIQVPVMIGFGQADYTIALPVGYGQAADDGRHSADKLDVDKPTVGYVGLNTGFNAYLLRSKSSQFLLQGAKVEDLGELYKIACTQEHHAMYGRALAREFSTMESPGKGDFKKQLKKVGEQGMDSHIPPNIPLYKSKDTEKENLLSDTKHQWAMTIDLNTCTGCNACLVACQAENNIPVVGKEQVAVGREMHWIRMDRYYAKQTYKYDDHGHKAKYKDGEKKGDYKKTPEWVQENPAMLPQPVACTQCESAPCETVCPVNATVHTEEGLNAMAYNRCIGTRYCANNCPFKARRFNFFDYNKRNPLIEKNLYKGPFGEKQEGDAKHLQRNPNVTVRMRGVMEKCTYCVQTLELAKIKQKQITKQKAEAAGSSVGIRVSDKDLMVPTDSVKVACQSACPSDSIAFGNLLNKDEKVNRAKSSLRNYELLKYIGTFSRTTYLARVKNPNPEMPDAKYIGLATINIH